MAWDALNFWDLVYHYGDKHKVVGSVQSNEFDYVQFVNFAFQSVLSNDNTRKIIVLVIEYEDM